MTRTPGADVEPDPTFALSVARQQGIETFDVPAKTDWTLLDALIWVRANIDESLLFLYSCKYNNTCKLCHARINGKPGYLCTTMLADGTHIEPINAARKWKDIAITYPPVW